MGKISSGTPWNSYNPWGAGGRWKMGWGGSMLLLLIFFIHAFSFISPFGVLSPSIYMFLVFSSRNGALGSPRRSLLFWCFSCRRYTTAAYCGTCLLPEGWCARCFRLYVDGLLVLARGTSIVWPRVCVSTRATVWNNSNKMWNHDLLLCTLSLHQIGFGFVFPPTKPLL